MWLDFFELKCYTFNSMLPVLILQGNLVDIEGSNSSGGLNDNTKVSYGGSKMHGQALLQWFTTVLSPYDPIFRPEYPFEENSEKLPRISMNADQ